MTQTSRVARRPRLLRGGLALLSLGFVVAGCSDDEPDSPGSPDSPASAVTTSAGSAGSAGSSSPVPDASGEAPTPPAVVLGPSPAAGQGFISYFLQVAYPYALRTNDPAPVTSLMGDLTTGIDARCTRCAEVTETLEAQLAAGAVTTMTDPVVDSVTLVERRTDGPYTYLDFAVEWRVDQQELVAPDGSVSDTEDDLRYDETITLQHGLSDTRVVAWQSAG